MHRSHFLSLSLALLGACTGEGTTSGGSDTTDTTSGAATDATTGAATDATTKTTNDATTGAASDATTGAASDATTDGETTAATTMTSDATTGDKLEYCHGFSVMAGMPFLEMHVSGGEMLVDGTTWPLECGGQGSWMFGLYPGLGGWDPGGDSVTFTIVVDVDGFNDNPDGHFFSGEVGYYIGCEDILGGVLGVAPVIPPDTLQDLSDLDGKQAKVQVSVPADGQTLMLAATVTLEAPKDLVSMGCGFMP